MELEITSLFQTIAPMDYSASAAELGQSAGQITWGHAVEDAPDFMPLGQCSSRIFRADDGRVYFYIGN
jgi:hypothetical protein